MKIRENKDGTRNLADLRKAVAELKNYSYHSQGGSWIIGTYNHHFKAWCENQAPYHWDERKVCENLLERSEDVAEMIAEEMAAK